MPGFIGLPEVILLGIIVLVLFGPKRLPEMGRSMGRGFREFKNSISGDKPDEDAFEIPVSLTHEDEVIEAQTVAAAPRKVA